MPIARKEIKTPAPKTRKQRISALLKSVEDKLTKEPGKITLADFIRLTQLEREMEDTERPTEIKVTWIERKEKSAGK